MAGVVCRRAPDSAGERLSLHADDTPLTFADVLAGWRDDALICEATLAVLAASPWPAIFWETPRLDRVALNAPYECMLLPARGLDKITPDERAFRDQFAAQPDRQVIVFDNLGGDATLVAPRPNSAPGADYGHLLAFVRAAPDEQRHELLKAVAETALKLVERRPVWISTSGLGVAWLHVRLDTRPKYYACHRYRTGT